MTIRFAAAWGGARPAIMRALCPSAPLGAVNDNRRAITLCSSAPRQAPPGIEVDGQQLLTDALRHFARYGLAAAARARCEAEVAQAAGDSQGRDRWIAICGQLDRRMANACARSLSLRD